MIQSMTGFGRGSISADGLQASVEIRAVNSRFLDVKCRMGKNLYFLEPHLRSLVEKSLGRGSIEVSVSLVQAVSSKQSLLRKENAEIFWKAAVELGEELDIPHGITVAELMKFPGVLGSDFDSLVDNEAEVAEIVETATENALKELKAMRSEEGKKLSKVFIREIEDLAKHKDWIAGHREEINAKYEKKIRSRWKDWQKKEDVPIDETRLAQELSYYLDRSDVTEELDRLNSHLKQLGDVFQPKEGKAVGKRVEFLLQEMGREVNTIGSKSDQVQVTQHVVEMKVILEKMREQAQNIE